MRSCAASGLVLGAMALVVRMVCMELYCGTQVTVCGDSHHMQSIFCSNSVRTYDGFKEIFDVFLWVVLIYVQQCISIFDETFALPL